MAEPQAPPFEEVATHLSEIFAGSFTIPSVRELKERCGGKGSIATYHDYIKRWMDERKSDAGIEATFLAITAEKNSHDAVMSMLFGRLKQQIMLSRKPADEPRSGEPRTQEYRSSDAPVSNGKPACDPKDAASMEQNLDEAFRRVAAGSVVRFAHATETTRETMDQSASNEERGLEMSGCSAQVPNVLDDPDNNNASLSRSNGGGHQAAYPAGSTQPAEGESDTFGGSANGTA